MGKCGRIRNFESQDVRRAAVPGNRRAREQRPGTRPGCTTIAAVGGVSTQEHGGRPTVRTAGRWVLALTVTSCTGAQHTAPGKEPTDEDIRSWRGCGASVALVVPLAARGRRCRSPRPALSGVGHRDALGDRGGGDPRLRAIRASGASTPKRPRRRVGQLLPPSRRRSRPGGPAGVSQTSRSRRRVPPSRLFPRRHRGAHARRRGCGSADPAVDENGLPSSDRHRLGRIGRPRCRGLLPGHPERHPVGHDCRGCSACCRPSGGRGFARRP